MTDLVKASLGRRSAELLLVGLWFLVLGWINQTQEYFVQSIFPYAIPVAVIAYRHRLSPGFLSAAFATFAAAPSEYLETHTAQEVMWAAFETYFKLTCIVLGADWMRRTLSNKRV